MVQVLVLVLEYQVPQAPVVPKGYLPYELRQLKCTALYVPDASTKILLFVLCPSKGILEESAREWLWIMTQGLSFHKKQWVWVCFQLNLLTYCNINSRTIDKIYPIPNNHRGDRTWWQMPVTERFTWMSEWDQTRELTMAIESKYVTMTVVTSRRETCSS